MGSKKDRHENLGYGKIGWTALQKIVYHPKFERVVKILETPRKTKNPTEGEIYKMEIKNLKDGAKLQI